MQSVLRRIGSKKIVFSVEIIIHSINISLSIEAGISIIWKRKKNRIETSNKHRITPNCGMIEINETLTMINTMYQEKSSDYIKKFAELTVQAHIDKKGKKKIGKVKIDLSEYIKGTNIKYFGITDCADKKASICISVKFTPVGETAIVEAISEGSCYSQISMGTEGDYSGPLFNDYDIVSEDQRLKFSTSLQKLPKLHSPVQRKQSIANVDNIALIRILQKENVQLKLEKEEFKTQISLISERAKSDRDEFIQHVDEVLLESQSNAKKMKLYKEKSKNFKGRLRESEREFEELKNDCIEYKSQFNIQDQRRNKEAIKEINGSLCCAIEEIEKLKSLNLNLSDKNQSLLETVESLKTANSKLFKDLEEYREKLYEGEDNHANPGFKNNLSKLKKELRDTQDEVEELRNKQTEYIASIHLIKMTATSKEDEFKSRIRKLEQELSERSQEIQELNSKLEEEISISKKLERKTLTVKEEGDSKVSKLAKNLKEIASEKEILEQNYFSIQRKVDKDKSSIDFDILTRAEARAASQKIEIQKLQEKIKHQEKTIIELNTCKEKILFENTRLQDHLTRLNVSKFSDPAFSALQEKVKFLEGKILDLEHVAIEEKERFNENMKVLEKQLELVEEQKIDQMRIYEEKINSLLVENKLMNEKERKSVIPGQFLNSMNEENLKQTIEMLNLKVMEYKNACEKLNEEVKVVENKYAESKVILKKKEMEKENFFLKYREAQDQLREYSSQYTVLEVELYKINERLGQALNNNNYLENELQEIKDQIFNFNHKKKRN